MFRDPRLVLVVAVAVGLWMPLVHLDWFKEFDDGAYILRTVEWAGELRAGHLYPRWAPDLYGGYGEPLFVFFAPAVYAVTGLLTATSFVDPVVALKIVALGGSVLSGVGVYALLYGETRHPDGALLGAVAYLAAPYRIGDLFVRGDFSEFCCIALLPCVLALYLAAAREARPFRARALAACGALLHSVMIATHTILGLWGTLLVGLVMLTRFISLYRSGAWRRVIPLTIALACAPALAGAYIVPAMAYRSRTHTEALITGFYSPQNHWITLKDLFTDRSYLFATNFNHVGQFVVIAVAVTAVGAALNLKRGRSALGWLLISLVLVVLTLPQGFGFWQPGRLPLAQFIQFPWRLLGPAVLAASIAIGIGAAAATERLAERLRAGIAIAGGAALLLFIAWPFVSPVPTASAPFPRDAGVIRGQIASTTSADEFLPLAIAGRPASPRGELVSGTQDASVERWFSDGSRHTLAVTATKPDATVRLAHYGFPGWAVKTRSGPASARLDTDAEGMIRLHLPNPGQYQLEVAYRNPPFVWLGFAVTGLALSILVLMLLRGSSWWPPRLSAMLAQSENAA